MIYVMSDIHGHRRRFDSVMKQINLQPEDTLYILGDVIDRNPDGIRILQQLRAMPNVVMLLGNHEYMMLDALYNIPDEEDGYADYLREKRLNLWYRNGGDVTHRYLKHIRKSVRQEILEYAANNYDGQAFAPKAQYYRHADGRDDGLKKIDPDSAEAFADWLENREKGGHPWEVCRGGNSTHVSLYVGLGRVAEGCYHLALAAKSYGRCVEAIKFYLALKHAGLPVIIYGAEFIKKRLLGLERVGIVPNEVMPFYCHSRFPGEDVDSFRHLNHENPDAEIALIEWQPIKPVKLKENAHE